MPLTGKIEFGESVNGVLRSNRGRGQKRNVFPRDKKRSKNPTATI